MYCKNLPISSTLNHKARDISNSKSSNLKTKYILFFLMLHIPLAAAMKFSSIISTTHALLALVVCFILLFRSNELDSLICLLAYMVSSETLWRLSHANVYWEYGKYAVSLILVIGTIKNHRLRIADKRPILYFFLLLPSIFILPQFMTKWISFNLSGPLSLAASVLFFSTVKISAIQTKRLLLALIAPAIGACYLATAGIMGYEFLEVDESSFLTSAGYGPNQMSTLLGLGGMCSCLYVFLFRESRLVKSLMYTLTLWLFAQCALTFSRGGLWTGLAGVTFCFFYLTRDLHFRKSVAPKILVFVIFTILVLFPKINEFTKGNLLERQKDIGTTGRDKIVLSDWRTFQKYPIFGVGPGNSRYHRGLIYRAALAHNEFSRMIAEHGILGLTAMVILALICIQRLLAFSTPKEKAIVISMTAWALLTMLHGAMRMAAPGFIFGLASASFTLKKYKNNLKHV
jgi:O-Antigen ligase